MVTSVTYDAPESPFIVWHSFLYAALLYRRKNLYSDFLGYIEAKTHFKRTLDIEQLGAKETNQIQKRNNNKRRTSKWVKEGAEGEKKNTASMKCTRKINNKHCSPGVQVRPNKLKMGKKCERELEKLICYSYGKIIPKNRLYIFFFEFSIWFVRRVWAVVVFDSRFSLFSYAPGAFFCALAIFNYFWCTLPREHVK